MVLRLALICHAPTAATRSLSFPSGEPLDGPGLERARTVAQHFNASARYLTSPATAARQTAEAMKLAACVEPELRDCHYGDWAGRPFDAVQAEDPAGIAAWLEDPAASPPGGEPVFALLERVSAWLGGQRDQPGPIVAITHASVVRAAVVTALGAPPRAYWRIDIAPLSLTWLHASHGRWTLASANQPLRRSRKS